MRYSIPNAFLAILIGFAARGTLAQVNVAVGTLQPGESVSISYEVTIESPITPGVTQISSQGVISGLNFSSVNTDDPETLPIGDATVTLLSLPAAVTDTIYRGENDDVKVKVATLLANDTDPENDTLTIASVGSATPLGSSVALNGDWIFYTHSGTTPGSFTYVVSDGNGGAAVGTVNVNIQGQSTQRSSSIQITVDGSGAHLTFNGIPNTSYTVEYTDDLNDPWDELGSVSNDTFGVFQYTDPAGSQARFYRFVYH